MQIRLNQLALEWFNDRNISFHNRFGVRLSSGDRINFQDNVEVEPYIGIHGGNTIPAMGFMSYTNSSLPADIKIGRYCSLASNLSFPSYRHPLEHISTSIFTHDYSTDLVVRFIRDHKPDYKNFFPNPQKGPVIIENDVWIGQDVSIMRGITIGTGAVIAANSVVTRDVMPYEIIGGSPAKLIKMRFSDDITDRLLKSEWWRYKFIDFMDVNLSKPAEFLNIFEQSKSSIQEYMPNKIKIADVVSMCE